MKRIGMWILDFDDFLARYKIYLTRKEDNINFLCRLGFYLYFKGK